MYAAHRCLSTPLGSPSLSSINVRGHILFSEAPWSNMCPHPIGCNVQGLADIFMNLHMLFDSPEAGLDADYYLVLSTLLYSVPFASFSICLTQWYRCNSLRVCDSSACLTSFVVSHSFMIRSSIPRSLTCDIPDLPYYRCGAESSCQVKHKPQSNPQTTMACGIPCHSTQTRMFDVTTMECAHWST